MATTIYASLSTNYSVDFSLTALINGSNTWVCDATLKTKITKSGSTYSITHTVTSLSKASGVSIDYLNIGTYYVKKSNNSHSSSTKISDWMFNEEDETRTLSSTASDFGGIYYTFDVISDDFSSSNATYTTEYNGSSETNTTVAPVKLILNEPPAVYFSLPSLYAGKPAIIKWSTSDADGDTVTTTSLIRYYKSSTASKYSSSTLISSSSTATSYNDTIPEIADGSVYYTIAVSDGKTTTYVTSSTVSVSTGGITGYVNIGGTNKELTGEGYVTIGGVQKEIVGSYVNIGGVWKESF